MSRLTEHTKHFDGKIGYKALGYSAMESYPFIDLIKKLSDYEDIGEPEELIKVVRCKDCLDWFLSENNNYGKCRQMDEMLAPDEYCSIGRKKEADK